MAGCSHTQTLLPLDTVVYGDLLFKKRQYEKKHLERLQSHEGNWRGEAVSREHSFLTHAHTSLQDFCLSFQDSRSYFSQQYQYRSPHRIQFPGHQVFTGPFKVYIQWTYVTCLRTYFTTTNGSIKALDTPCNCLPVVESQ